MRFTRGLRGILLSVSRILLAVLMVSLAVTPVAAQATDPNASNLTATLIPAFVSAAEINQYFDADGIIVVNDMTDHFMPTGTSGDAFIQTRLFPKGETRATASLYAYLYRVDLRNLASTSNAKVCVSKISLPFGPVAPSDYDNDAVLEHYFIINEGGALGSVTPSTVLQNDEINLIIEFNDPVCSGVGSSAGQSSFFIGFSSYEPYKSAKAQLTLFPSGTGLALDARVPFASGAADCVTIADPAEIPSPATINFDSLKNEAIIGSIYQSSYGVTFGTGVKVKANEISTPFTARSTPNVAYAPYSVAVATSIQFSFALPVTHVGFYAGNASSVAVEALITAWNVTAGIPDDLVCQFRTTLPSDDLSTFIGFYDPLKLIDKVQLEFLQSADDEIIDDLIFSPGNGGDRIEFPRPVTSLSGDGPEIIINKSDNTRFAATFNLPDPSLWMEQADGDNKRLRFGLPGSEINSNQDGYPDVPVITRLIAIPEGSTPVLGSISALARGQFLADLYPSQPSAMDVDTDPPGDPDPNVWADPPYYLDPAAYALDAKFPTEPAGIYPVGKMRDLNLALLVVAGGQYNPKTRQLTIFKQVDVEVLFQGGNGAFLPDYSNNPFEPALAKQYGYVLNTEVIGDFLKPLSPDFCAGHEFIIFTPSAFQAAADALADFKNDRGISTQVVVVTAPNLSDIPSLIQEFIKDQYENCIVRPSYVLLLGDAEFIPAFPHNGTNSDLDYALMTVGDTFPDLAYGRIPVDTLAQAKTVVNKIIAYEGDPPALTSFYNKVALASFFECCEKIISWDSGVDARSFIETSETVRAALVSSGKTVNRIYTSNAYSLGADPSFYLNEAVLPTDLWSSNGFHWDGNTTDVINAFNSGTGLIMHRGHGWPGGWAAPIFNINNLSSLTIGNLTPVVYSINCASGVWDNEMPGSGLLPTDVSWIERMLRMFGGAVGLIGDVRDSPTWANSALARGLFDATWPATDPTYGSSTVHNRLGDILNYGKLYMFAQVWTGEIGNEDYEFNNLIYHVIGDPTMKVWKSAPPHAMVSFAAYHWGGLPLTSEKSLQATHTLTVEYPIEGAEITVLQNGLPIGRGTVVGGLAEILFVAEFNPKMPLQVSACVDDDVCAVLNSPYQYLYLPLINH
ncbi:MAG: C25 family cysteine peptidase [Bellilinea sp.]